MGVLFLVLSPTTTVTTGVRPLLIGAAGGEYVGGTVYTRNL